MAKRYSKPSGNASLVTFSPVKFFILSGLVLALAFTISLLRQSQNIQQYAARSCVERPSCLDAKPYACSIPAPKEGWCPKPVTHVVLPSPAE